MPAVPLILIVLALLVAVPIFTWFAFTLGKSVFIFGLATLPSLVLLANRPNLWMILLAWVFASNIRVLLGGSLSLFTLLCAGLTVILLARIIISKRTNPYGKMARWWGISFVVVVGMTMYMRGIGFAFLGGEQVGGMRYIVILTPLCLFIFSSLLNLSRREWQIALYGMCVAGLFPGIAEAAFHLSDGRFYHLYYLIQPKSSLGVTIEASAAGAELIRYKSATETSRYILLFALLAFPGTGKKSHLRVLFVLVALVIGGLSGHRQNMVYLLGILLIFGFFRSPGHRIRYSIACASLGVAGTLCLYVFAPYLPYNLQRSISWLPRIPVDHKVKLSALGTTDWRILVWGQGMKEIPQYFWLGKGYAYQMEVYQRLATMERKDAFVESAVLTVDYHNGPLGLIIGLGIFGVIAASGFFGTFAIQQSIMATGKWVEPTLERYHLALLSMYLARIPSFLIISGNVHTTFPDLFFLCILLQGLTRTELRTRLETAQKNKEQELLEKPRTKEVPLAGPAAPVLRRNNSGIS